MKTPYCNITVVCIGQVSMSYLNNVHLHLNSLRSKNGGSSAVTRPSTEDTIACPNAQTARALPELTELYFSESRRTVGVYLPDDIVTEPRGIWLENEVIKPPVLEKLSNSMNENVYSNQVDTVVSECNTGGTNLIIADVTDHTARDFIKCFLKMIQNLSVYVMALKHGCRYWNMAEFQQLHPRICSLRLCVAGKEEGVQVEWYKSEQMGAELLVTFPVVCSSTLDCVTLDVYSIHGDKFCRQYFNCLNNYWHSVSFISGEHCSSLRLLLANWETVNQKLNEETFLCATTTLTRNWCVNLSKRRELDQPFSPVHLYGCIGYYTMVLGIREKK